MHLAIIVRNVYIVQAWLASLASVSVIPGTTKEILVVFQVSITQAIYSGII